MKNILTVLKDPANLAVLFGSAMLAVAIGGIISLQILSMVIYPVSAQLFNAIVGFIAGYKVVTRK